MKYIPAPEVRTTIQDHAAACTSICNIPGAITTRCTNITTKPKMSERHTTAMPLSSQKLRLPNLACRLARKKPRDLWPFSVASCAGVDPSVSLASSADAPPACASMCAASLLPRIAAQCSGVHPSLSGRLRWQPAKSSRRTVSGKPLYAAQCSGDRPSLSCPSISAFHRILKW